MENNLENKSKFFALYWGFKCLRNELLNDNIPALKVDISNCKGLPQQHLELKPLSQISDEDAIIFFDILWSHIESHKNKPRDFKIDFGKDWALSPLSERYGLIPTGLFHGVDYLRSRGYALPWMGLSVEQLIEYGWVKLNKG